jgi:hypothetical protein
MKRPIKEDYYFNDNFDLFKYANDLGKYTNYLESKNNFPEMLLTPEDKLIITKLLTDKIIEKDDNNLYKSVQDNSFSIISKIIEKIYYL